MENCYPKLPVVKLLEEAPQVIQEVHFQSRFVETFIEI